MFCRLVVICLVQWIYVAEGLLFKPRDKCVPTAAVRGACHECVCSTEGVYHCTRKKCDKNETETTDLVQECEPLFTYVEKVMICSCTATGYWRSSNCRNRFRYIQIKNTLTNQMLRTNIACQPNMLYLIDCNICRCEANGLLKPSSCTNRPCAAAHKAEKCKAGEIQRFSNELCACSGINYFIDRLCFPINNDTLQTVEEKNLEKLVYADRTWRRNFMDNYRCNHTANFTMDCNTCICKNNSLVCTKKLCYTGKAIRKTFVENTGEVLPELKSSDEKCIPGRKYRFRCNTCVCADDELPTCTTMLCLEDFMLNVDSLRTVLKTPDKPNLTNIARTSPELHEGAKCVPGETYRVDCNTCLCKNDGTLICTKAVCLKTPKSTKKKNTKKFQQKRNESASSSARARPKALRLLRKKKLLQLSILPDSECVPGKIYRRGCQRCFCDENKEVLCTKKKDACDDFKTDTPFHYLEDIRPPFQPEEVETLPELPQRQVECSPGKSYRVDCNGCVCSLGHNLFCDELICLSYDDMHRIEADDKSKTPCKPEEYKRTEENCVVCDCVKNKLRCHEVVGCISENDKKLPNWNNGKPKLTLDMYRDTCIPGGVYRMDCNNCYCQEDKTLRCTQKTCLNYSQSKALEKQRLFLIQNGL